MYQKKVLLDVSATKATQETRQESALNTHLARKLLFVTPMKDFPFADTIAGKSVVHAIFAPMERLAPNTVIASTVTFA